MHAVQDLINTLLFFQMLCNASIKPTRLKKKIEMELLWALVGN